MASKRNPPKQQIPATASRPPSDYPAFLAEIKHRIEQARVSVIRSASREAVLLYWDIGQGIAEKQAMAGWGNAVVEKLSRDLSRAFPGARGFSAQNLWRMRQFYVDHSSPEFLSHAVRELGIKGDREQLSQAVREFLASVPWGHHANALAKVDDPAAKFYYVRATVQLGWTRDVLLNQIKAQAYERAVKEKKTHNFPAALPEHLAEQADEIVKSRYDFGFLGIGQAIKERELEDRLIDGLQSFILELGYGFCFIGRQFRLTTGRKEYFVDLLFYHRFLKALVAFELKIGAFEPEHAGQMDFYLNLLNEKEKAPDDAPTIGIILCAEKDDIDVEFALKSKTNPIGVAAYQLRTTLPVELKGRIPSARQLAEAIREHLPTRK
jgi:predicted nuclease of restriction endonuclease-like (RecB) superfamily